MMVLRFVAWLVLWTLGGFVGYMFGYCLSFWLAAANAPGIVVEHADTFLMGMGGVLAVLLARGADRG